LKNNHLAEKVDNQLLNQIPGASKVGNLQF